MSIFPLFLYLLFSLTQLIDGMPTGAPCSALENMSPSHENGHSLISADFMLKFPENNHNCFHPNNTLKVELSGKLFKGFIIQARLGNHRRIGWFETEDLHQARIQCDEPGSVTHKDATELRNIFVHWHSPNYLNPGDAVTFHAVVVTNNSLKEPSNWHSKIQKTIFMKEDCKPDVVRPTEDPGFTELTTANDKTQTDPVLIQSEMHGKVLTVPFTVGKNIQEGENPTVMPIHSQINAEYVSIYQQWLITPHYDNFVFISPAAYPDMILVSHSDTACDKLLEKPLRLVTKMFPNRQAAESHEYWRLLGPNKEFIVSFKAPSGGNCKIENDQRTGLVMSLYKNKESSDGRYSQDEDWFEAVRRKDGAQVAVKNVNLNDAGYGEKWNISTAIKYRSNFKTIQLKNVGAKNKYLSVVEQKNKQHINSGAQTGVGVELAFKFSHVTGDQTWKLVPHMAGSSIIVWSEFPNMALKAGHITSGSGNVSISSLDNKDLGHPHISDQFRWFLIGKQLQYKLISSGIGRSLTNNLRDKLLTAKSLKAEDGSPVVLKEEEHYESTPSSKWVIREVKTVKLYVVIKSQSNEQVITLSQEAQDDGNSVSMMPLHTDYVPLSQKWIIKTFGGINYFILSGFNRNLALSFIPNNGTVAALPLKKYTDDMLSTQLWKHGSLNESVLSADIGLLLVSGYNTTSNENWLLCSKDTNSNRSHDLAVVNVKYGEATGDLQKWTFDFV